VPLSAGTRVGPMGTPVQLFEGSSFLFTAGLTMNARTYDVSPDGRRFLMIKNADAPSSSASARIVLVQNWFEELKAKVPVR
jgi:hypothetical protein